MSELGSVNLKDGLGIAIKVIRTVDKALDDGKISIVEGAQIAVASISFWRVVKNAKALRDEFLSLNDAKRDEFVTYFVKNFDLRNDNAEQIIEELFAALLTIAAVVVKVK